MDLLYTLAAFAVALGVLIAFHEFGHFWMARRAGVKVLRFSIGFGRPLYSRRFGADRTEFVIAALPLGGYVKMLDEREAPVAEQDLSRAFNRQSVGKRIAIVAAGPAANFLFAIAAYWLMFVIGVSGLQAILGEVPAQTPAAQAGLEQGQRVVAVQGRATPTWNAAMEALLPHLLDGGPVRIEVEDAAGERAVRVLELPRMGADLDPREAIRALGLTPFQPRVPPVIGEVLRGGAAAEAGIVAGDRVLRIDGQPVDDWQGLAAYIAERPGQWLTLELERSGQPVQVRVRPVADADGLGRIGVAVRMPELDPSWMGVERYGPLQAAWSGAERTWEMTTLTLRLLGRMIVGQASVENLSGPITIAQYAGHTASIGLAQFLAFLAIVSISLGILNLLPIPLLDGGHLLYYLVEIVKGSPVSEQTQLIGQRIGIVMLLALMTLAFYNDLARLLR
ncbi:RIP metalloprotease RseP [Ectothiorhodospiraceae bacterium 2226]|nr:RIP metalloprotease RseP [Ectothiorhodospiraceae bacterium 2226]